MRYLVVRNMNRRQFLAGIGSAAGFVHLAGCSQLSGDNGGGNNDSGKSNNTVSSSDGGGNSVTDGGSGSGDGTNDRSTGTGDGNPDGTNTEENAGTTTDGEDIGLPDDSDEALETGRTPPEETGTPFENTPTIPEEEGLETGQAPNATTE